MDPAQAYLQNLTRRELLRRGGTGVGSLALSWLLAQDARAGISQNPLAPKPTHFAPKAKNVIFMHMIGGPSTIDLFDNKLELKKRNGEPVPEELVEHARFAFISKKSKLLASEFKYARHGEGGVEMSHIVPKLAEVADDLAIVKTLHTEQFNHAPAQLFYHTGFGQFGRPTVGSWVTYGLGTENQDLPAFVVLNSGGGTGGAGTAIWSNGFLPSVYQGIEFRNQGDPVLFLSNPQGVARDDRRRMLDDLQALNRSQLDLVGDPEIATRIEQYELAFRMQTAVPDLMDLSKEPKHIHDLYGSKPGGGSFANHCLLARRLVESGVRFVQLCNNGWDHHGGVFSNMPKKCKEIDQPIAALIRDLKQRGLLDETLIVWGGEFGRTPMAQGDRKSVGRDHHKDAYCTLLAGGGVKGGTTVGRTDDFGYYPTEDPVHINDLHATMLHLLGMDHEQLTYKFQGRDFRLTDVAGHVVQKLLA